MINNRPLVSVILPVYNDETNIENAVNSILNQTYHNIELLIYDDGSNDTTKKILSNINSPSIRIYSSEKNLGLTKALNFLISKSNGEIIARQDSDDISHLNRIEMQVNYLQSHKLDATASRARRKNSIRKIPAVSFYLPLKIQVLYKNPMIHGTLMIKKSVLEELSLYNEEFKYSQDFKLLIDLLNNGYKFRILNKVLYELNLTNNISSKFKDDQRKYFKMAKKDYKLFNL